MFKPLLVLSASLLLIACEQSTDDTKTWVYINDASIQCEYDGMSEYETQKTLENNNVEVFESKCGHLEGMMVASQCGLANININLHLIDKNNISEANKLGYITVTSLETEDGQGYEENECH